MMLKTEMSPTVSLLENGHWNRLECDRCGLHAHGPVGAALPVEEQEKFLIFHRTCRKA